MYDDILVPTDGSSGVERAIRHAVDLAAVHDATVHLLYVVNTAAYGTVPMETSWEGITDVLHDEGEAALERARDICEGGNCPVSVAMVDGSPSSEIVRYAAENDCDLIVMGTHGRGGLNRLLLGSVAERVVRQSEVPVLTVRVGDDAGEEEQATATGEEEATAE